jgi:ATP-dependent helicase YprA (DUF1998 family)
MLPMLGPDPTKTAAAEVAGEHHSAFHPAVSGWLRSRFGQPTEAQRRAWPVTAQRRHALIAAPTGSGKTLAAFLSAINRLVVDALAHGRLDDAVQVLYVSPLKALSNDIRKNLQEPLEGTANGCWRWACTTPASAPRCAPATRRRPSASACGASHHTFW